MPLIPADAADAAGATDATDAADVSDAADAADAEAADVADVADTADAVDAVDAAGAGGHKEQGYSKRAGILRTQRLHLECNFGSLFWIAIVSIYLSCSSTIFINRFCWACKLQNEVRLNIPSTCIQI